MFLCKKTDILKILKAFKLFRTLQRAPIKLKTRQNRI